MGALDSGAFTGIERVITAVEHPFNLINQGQERLRVPLTNYLNALVLNQMKWTPPSPSRHQSAIVEALTIN
ncbi:MAG: hypothetical protein R3F50_00815 [Gammaproteobacteria bacterium]